MSSLTAVELLVEALEVAEAAETAEAQGLNGRRAREVRSVVSSLWALAAVEKLASQCDPDSVEFEELGRVVTRRLEDAGLIVG